MPFGDDGKRKYNIQNYNPDKNYVQDILGSDQSWRYVKGPEPLIKYIENHKTEDVNLQKNLPDQSIIPYKGKKSAFTELSVTPDERGVIKNADIPEFKVAAEDDFVTDDSGGQIPVKLLRKDKYEQHFENIPANKKVLDALWNQHKERNGIVSKNATEEDKRKRAFALGVVEAHDPSQMTRQTSQHLPRNTTNNTFNVGGGAGDLQLNNLYKRIKGAIGKRREQGQEFLPAELLKQDEADLVLKTVRNRYTTDEKKEISLADYKLIEGDDGSVRIFDRNTDDFVAFIGEEAADIPAQISVKEKREKLEQINKNKKAQPNQQQNIAQTCH